MFGPFASVLVANRGEIAVRVIRAAHDEGLRAIAVYADPDAEAPHVRLADEAYALHGSTSAQTYLDIAKVVDAALASGAQAVHPGYGFLSENADFARAVIAAGLVWIGPPPEAIERLGDKVSARAIARRVGAPMAPGTDRPVDSAAEVEEFVAAHGLPVAIKAAFGGGGRGLRVVREAGAIAEELNAATREAAAAFGRGECFVERYLDRPRHVEAQVLLDRYGAAIVVGTRDCSLQRRHQKLVEEAPAPFLAEAQREVIVSSAKEVCRAAGYVGAGTVEFLIGEDGMVSFLEVNTRLQVEHPVTEETSGVDLVAEQFAIARGERLRLDADPVAAGHSIELRINSEDPAQGFRPTPGVIARWQIPQGPGIRLDAGVEEGSVVTELYDSMLAKLIVTGRDRPTALARARRALDEVRIDGVPTVLAFDRAVLSHPDFVAAEGSLRVHTGWIEENLERLLPQTAEPAAEDPADEVTVTIGRQAHRVALPGLALLGERAEEIRAHLAHSATEDGADDGLVLAPMQGTVVKLAVRDGSHIDRGEVVAVLEAMKMENPVRASRTGVVRDLQVAVGETRAQGQLICRIDDDEVWR